MWQPIDKLDRTKMQYLLVAQDGAVRLHLWNPHRNIWERAEPIGSIVQIHDDCGNPSHFMECPNPPNDGTHAQRKENL